MLQLFYLVEVVDERFGDLLDQERAIGDLVLDLLLRTLESLRVFAHILGCDGFGDLTGAL